MKIKGINRLNAAVSHFTEQFGISASLGIDFYSYPDEDKVAFSLTLVDDAGTRFIRDINEHHRLGLTENSIFLMSLLHEIGHCLTEHLISDEERIEIDTEKEKIDTEMAEGGDRDMLYDRYFRMKDEELATNWAVAYIKENEEACTAAWNRIREAIEHFYVINKIEYK